MHPEVQSDKPGTCSICGMKLVASNSSSTSYKPLFIIIALILLVTFVLSVHDFFNQSFLLEKTVSYFMAGFFLVFSGFKLIDVKGFAEGYSTYDLLSRRVFVYGYVYPFIELFLGLAYLTGFQLQVVNTVTLIVMFLVDWEY